MTPSGFRRRCLLLTNDTIAPVYCFYTSAAARSFYLAISPFQSNAPVEYHYPACGCPKIAATLLEIHVWDRGLDSLQHSVGLCEDRVLVSIWVDLQHMGSGYGATAWHIRLPLRFSIIM